MSIENQNTTPEKIAQERNIADIVLNKINAFQTAGQLKLPPGYSSENALKAAFLILSETKNSENKYALDHCSRESIANALLKMVVWGLNPMKKQCDFIMYGNKLECSIEYTGNVALAKRYGSLKRIKANAIMKGDDFKFTTDPNTGRKKIVKHEQTLDSIGCKEILGAYAVYELNDGTIDVEIMSAQQIKDAWNQGAMKGNSPAHRNFPDQMANKTVINRACKLLIRSSDDSVLYSTEEEDVKIDPVAEDVSFEIMENSNKEPITLDFKEPVKKEEVKKEEATNNNKHNDPGF